MKVARCILKVGESGFEGWLEMKSEIVLPGGSFGDPVLHVKARYALLQGALPPLGLVAGVSNVFGITAPDLSASASGVHWESSGSLGSSGVEAKARQALSPSAPPAESPQEVAQDLVTCDPGKQEQVSEPPPEPVVDDISPLDAWGERIHRRTKLDVCPKCPGRRLEVIEEFEEEVRQQPEGQQPEVGVLGGSTLNLTESNVFKTELTELEVEYNWSSIFYIPPEVFTFAPLETQDKRMQQISKLPNKHPFPAEPQ